MESISHKRRDYQIKKEADKKADLVVTSQL